MSMADFRFILSDLATAFREDAIWRNAIIPGRFIIDPFDVPTAPVEPGIGEVETWWYVERAIMPRPLPELINRPQLIIRQQVYEIVQIHEDDIGELGYRLIKEEIGLNFPGAEPAGDWDDGNTSWDRGQSRWDLLGDALVSAAASAPGRPSRRPEIERALNEAATAGVIGPNQPMRDVVRTVQSRIPGEDRRGLGDRTMRRVILQRRGPRMRDFVIPPRREK